MSTNPGRRVARNTLLLLAKHVVVTLTGIAITAYVAQKLGPDDFGLFEYAFAFVVGFELVSSFGLRAVTVRSVAESEGLDEVDDYTPRMVALRVVLALFVLIPLGLTSWGLGHERQVMIAVGIAALILPLQAISHVLRDMFQGLERFDVEALTGVVARFGTAGAALAVLLLGGGVLEVVAAYAAGALLRMAVPMVAAWRDGRRFWPRWSTPFANQQLRQGWPFAGTAVLALLMWEVNPVLLGELSTMASVGLFAAATKLFVPLEVIPESLSSALSPAVTKGWAAKDPATEGLLQRAVFALLALGLPAGLGGALAAEPIVQLLFGATYAEATLPMQVLLLALPFEFVSVPAFYALGAIHQQRVALGVTVAGAATNIGLAVALAPRYGALGCAISASAAIVICAVAVHVALGRHYRVWTDWRAYGKLALANGAMVGVVLMVRDYGALACMAAGATVYGLLVSVLGVVSLGELRALFRGQT